MSFFVVFFFLFVFLFVVVFCLHVLQYNYNFVPIACVNTHFLNFLKRFGNKDLEKTGKMLNEGKWGLNIGNTIGNTNFWG